MVIILHDAIYSDPQDFLKSDVDETVENQNLQLFFNERLHCLMDCIIHTFVKINQKLTVYFF